MSDKIGYKIGGCFEDFGENGESFAFEILFPMIYDTKEEILNGEHDAISAAMEKQSDGEVVINLYYNWDIIETIRWNEWWKYKCSRMRDESKGELIADARDDFEPCCIKFEDIYGNFVGEDEDDNRYELQYLAYWVEPTFV